MENRGRRGRGGKRGAKRGCGRLRERLVFEESTPLEEPAQPSPVRAAPACKKIALTSKQQKANKALNRKRIFALPPDLREEYKKQKSAKELHVGFMPGVPESTAKRRPSSLSFESGSEVPLVPGTPAVLPAPLPPPWARSAPSTTAGPSRDTSNVSPVADPSRVNLSPSAMPAEDQNAAGPLLVNCSPEAGPSWADDLAVASPLLEADDQFHFTASPGRHINLTPPPHADPLFDDAASPGRHINLTPPPHADTPSDDAASPGRHINLTPPPHADTLSDDAASPGRHLNLTPPPHADAPSDDAAFRTPSSSYCHSTTVAPAAASTPLHVPSPAAFMDITESSTSSPAISGLSADPATVDSDTDGMRNGSDVEAEDQADNEVYQTFRAPTLATDSPAVLADLDPKVVNAVDQMDRLNDAAIRATLPVDRIVFDWRSDLTGFTGVREKFTGIPGPTFPLSEIESPVNVFLKFWDLEIMSLIENETNSYAAHCLNKPDLKRNSRTKRWQPTSVHELYVFFAVLIQQSLFPATVESEYFYPASRMTAMPFFKEYISYNRLLLLKKFLHFANNGNMSDSLSTEERRLYKIQPIIGHLKRKFQDLYLPGQNVAIDESLLKWHGHLTFIQKIATKAAKTGIKSYELCESRTGYLWQFTIYAGGGQGQDQPNRPDGNDETEQADETDLQPAGATARIVFDLAKPLFEKGYTIIMDNFYNSPLLARSLKLRGTDCYGTFRLNRENVPESMKSISKQQLKTGDVVSSTSGDINVIVWKDSNVVSMISTYHKVEAGAAEKYGRWKFKPQVVLDYNKAMGGVDKKDQMLANFPMERSRNSIWYKKLFRRLVNISVLNAYIIYKCKDVTYASISHRTFRLQVAEGLLKMFCQHRIGRHISSNVVTTRQVPSIKRGKKPRPVLENNHFPVRLTEQPLRKTCVWCSELNKRSRTMWMCDVCEVALCVECMKPYHTGVRPD